ncbi:YeeE/YedE thiosulfate transporter family protein [Massilia sp. H6]|uniref:YeeE/YedE thiosulfate transporter family protein n=1 Tax=Massilia sp. H6 TaxID=2970464 RepID=UPI00216963FE|nr:YeeE/YedE thiosulfate transporter family protein [Massilia sp. H6]UVW30072.1 YeeE/YedE thiosulfate transporter family protein [Massilia sp. H6]
MAKKSAQMPAEPLAGKGQAGADHPGKEAADSAPAPRQLLLGLVFGIMFGFLLQKGGVAKYEVLMGALLLTDFTVMKIMLSAILVGMIGIFGMHALGLVKLHVKPTKYAANIIGGLIFGIGFALIGYCPGTGAAALGQGNLDAIPGIAGLLAGSYLYAEFSKKLSATVLTWGDRGCIMLPELIGVGRTAFLFAFAPAILAVLAVLYWFAP